MSLWFAYWAAFLLVLEPGNVLRASRAGQALTFPHEAVRITAAALLGTLVTPIVLVLARRLPLQGPRRVRNALVHTAAAIGTAFGLIVISCFAAAWLFEGCFWPSLSALRDQLLSNWLLLVFAIAALTALAHLILQKDETTPADSSSRGITVRSRGRLRFVKWADVDWIEAQGNYLALHLGPACYLVRSTVAGMASQLTAEQFIRVHRRAIVAISRIEALRPLPNGDAVLTLADGHEVRASRRYRQALNKALEAHRVASGLRRASLPALWDVRF